MVYNCGPKNSCTHAIGALLNMPLTQRAKDLLRLHPNKPFVGLINKNTKTIVLAPRIPKKVSLIVNQAGEAIAAAYVKDDNRDIADSTVHQDELDQINALLKEGDLPRLACCNEGPSPFDEKSSHEMLFEDQCKSTSKADWGGFALSLNPSGEVQFMFSSGAFNTPASERKRKRGAQLGSELRDEVIRQIDGLSPPPSHEDTNAILPITEDTPGPSFFSRKRTPLPAPVETNRYSTPPRDGGGTSFMLGI